jgi:glucose/arabinose dehydrogenase
MRVALCNLALFATVFAACGARESAASSLHVPAGFAVEKIADVPGARELAALPNGDLIAGTRGRDVYLVPNAEGIASAPVVFASFDDDVASGVAYASEPREIFVGTAHHVWAIRYAGERKAKNVLRVADVRTGSEAPGTDGDVHWTTSVAYTGGLLYAAAGSSCNATMSGGQKPCAEVDPTRAAVSVMHADGSGFAQRARRIRNAIALAVNPQTGSLWIGGAGQDSLPFGHPYEFLDDLTAHAGDADYGWPVCEENHRAYWPDADCAATVEPLVALPAYATIIGATFYPPHQTGDYAFPPPYRGGLFVTTHGSWHRSPDGCAAQPPRVVFVAMRGDRPAKTADWNDPSTQWTNFITGFQTGCTSRAGRAAGITVGPKGSLFVTDDAAGAIYRIRPLRRE